MHLQLESSNVARTAARPRPTTLVREHGIAVAPERVVAGADGGAVEGSVAILQTPSDPSAPALRAFVQDSSSGLSFSVSSSNARRGGAQKDE
ncbi:MAG: hypothetical protein GY906_00420 [bacterium]|nr:hypothetical protein [bacterium]